MTEPSERRPGLTRMRNRLAPVIVRAGWLAGCVLVLAGCTAPVATFVATGYQYPYRAKSSADVVVYMKPNEPARPYRVVGSVIVTPPSSDAALADYIAVLKDKAAAVGVDGVTNVEAAPRTMTSASGGCMYGSPYYSQSSSTAYDVKGDAFVWAESTAALDTTRLNVCKLDSLELAYANAKREKRGTRGAGWTHWGAIGVMGAVLVAIITLTAINTVH